MRGSGETPSYLGTKKRAVLFLRWVVIIVTSYLLVFGRETNATDGGIAIFVVLLLATNLVAGALPEPLFETTWFQGLLVTIDTLLISGGMLLAGETSAELFLLYFSVLFVAALGENLLMIIGGCLLIGAVYLLVLMRTEAALLTPAVLLRFPFLFAIATFYGYLVEVAKVERRRAEIAVAHEKFRTDFLATLTHDLQSPLSAIAGFTRILLEAPDEASAGEYRRMFEAIGRGANECSELVANFLAMARGEAKPNKLRRQVVDLNSLAEEVHQMHESAARQKEVRIRLRLADRLPVLSGDRMQLRRGVSNLLGNAVKFSPDGGEIEVNTAVDETAVELSISDQGPGISRTDQGKIFESYASGDGESSGTGLGLFIVRLVAEAHGGSIRVDSRPGRGARFTLRLPLPVDAEIAPATPPRKGAIAPRLRTVKDGGGMLGNREVLS